MKISELNIGQGNIDVEGIIKEVGEIKTFNKFGRELSVADAILEDDSGAIKLSLWNDDARNFKKSDKIKVINGYVNEFQGEKQLTAGKFGKIEMVENSSSEDSEEGQTQLDSNSSESLEGNETESRGEDVVGEKSDKSDESGDEGISQERETKSNDEEPVESKEEVF